MATVTVCTCVCRLRAVTHTHLGYAFICSTRVLAEQCMMYRFYKLYLHASMQRQTDLHRITQLFIFRIFHFTVVCRCNDKPYRRVNDIVVRSPGRDATRLYRLQYIHQQRNKFNPPLSPVVRQTGSTEIATNVQGERAREIERDGRGRKNLSAILNYFRWMNSAPLCVHYRMFHCELVGGSCSLHDPYACVCRGHFGCFHFFM